jgi:hypothetical protein
MNNIHPVIELFKWTLGIKDIRHQEVRTQTSPIIEELISQLDKIRLKFYTPEVIRWSAIMHEFPNILRKATSNVKQRCAIPQTLQHGGVRQRSTKTEIYKS